MPKSSVGSTGVPADDALLAHYPEDDIQESTVCELHIKLKNLSMKVMDGIALPNAPKALLHGNPIPPGYACVGVDEVLSGYESLDLDYLGGQGEQTLEKPYVVSLYGKRNASCFQTRCQGHRLLLQIRRINRLQPTSRRNAARVRDVSRIHPTPRRSLA